MTPKTALTFIAMSIPFLLLTIWMLVDISLKDFKSMGEKVLWWLVTLTPFVGWLIYLIFGFRRGKRPVNEP